jgi:hypothetical protein
MKRLSISFALILSLIAPITTPAKASNSVTSLTVAGFKVSWPQYMYMPTGCSRFEFSYTNGAPYEFLKVGFQLTSPYGDSVAEAGLVGAPPGRSGIWDQQICAHNLSGLGPYKMKVYITDYSTRGGGSLQDYADVYFTSRTAAIPAPKLSDSVITDDVRIKTLSAEIASLKAKIKRICLAKPKPKGC